MPKITEKQLISKLQLLKEIKPREEWASLLKSQILVEKTEIVAQPARFAKFMDTVLRLCSGQIFSRKFAYSFAVLVFIFVGLVGFAGNTVPGDLLFPVKKLAEQSQASLTGQTGLQQNVANLNSRINDLAQVAKDGKKNNIPSVISEISLNAKDLAKSIKDNPVNDPKTLAEIADSLKTLANVPGTDLTKNQDVKDLYQIVVENQIADLEKTTLTDEQKITLVEAQDLCEQGKYSDALEKILLINK
ncbi:MAG: hypothetical protein M0Q46_06685 [Endomicrobiales bacterium]|nr:hypothetical protein [Endomicrobiales bacterium]